MREFNEISFIECYNIHNVDYLLSSGRKHLTELIKKNNPEKHRNAGESTKDYSGRVYNLLKRIKKSGDGSIIVKYKHGTDKTEGRNFSKCLAIQGIPTNIKNFIVNPEWKDYDMVNCFPVLLLHLARKSTTLDNDDVKHLSHYVNNRELVLEKYGLTKNDIIMTLFKDNARPTNPHLRELNNELKNIKKNLVENSNVKTTNTKNPISSIVSHLLNILESEILYSVFKKHPNRDIALCFDGFMSGEDIEVSELDEITKEYGIKWKIKDTTTDIIVPDNFEYDEFKIEKTTFEEDNHKILTPFHYMCRIDGEWIPTNHTTLEQRNAEMPKFDDGKVPFIKKWCSDPSIKTFDKIQFNPYNKNPDPTRTNVFNTFVPLTRIDAPIGGDYTDFIDNYFNVLLYNLCERNDEMTMYLKKYIAHMIQYPEQLPETIVYIRGNQGIGKDSLIMLFTRLINNENYTITVDDPRRIFGQFNKDASEKLMICINELSPKDATEYENKIKSFSTKVVVKVEHKGINGTTGVKNCARLFVLSNNIEIVPLTHSSRREFVIEGYAPSECKDECKLFWDKLYEYIENDTAINHLFHYLNNINLDGFNTRHFKRGRFYSTLAESSIPPIITFLYKMNYDELSSHQDGDTLITHTDFAVDYNEYCIDNNAKHKKLSHAKIETALNDVKHLVRKTKLNASHKGQKRTMFWKFNKDVLINYIKQVYYQYEYKVDELDEKDIKKPQKTNECKIKDDL